MAQTPTNAKAMVVCMRITGTLDFGGESLFANCRGADHSSECATDWQNRQHAEAGFSVANDYCFWEFHRQPACGSIIRLGESLPVVPAASDQPARKSHRRLPMLDLRQSALERSNGTASCERPSGNSGAMPTLAVGMENRFPRGYTSVAMGPEASPFLHPQPSRPSESRCHPGRHSPSRGTKIAEKML